MYVVPPLMGLWFASLNHPVFDGFGSTDTCAHSHTHREMLLMSRWSTGSARRVFLVFNPICCNISSFHLSISSFPPPCLSIKHPLAHTAISFRSLVGSRSPSSCTLPLQAAAYVHSSVNAHIKKKTKKNRKLFPNCSPSLCLSAQHKQY